MRIKNVSRRRMVVTTKENGELDISTARLPLYKELYSIPWSLQICRSDWWFNDFGYGLFDLGFFDGKNTIYGYEAFGCTFPALVRPVLEISNINASDLRIQDTFEFGGKKFEIFSEAFSKALAFCLEDIGSWCLGKGYESYQEQEVNNIAVHSVTHFIDDWFEKSKQENK